MSAGIYVMTYRGAVGWGQGLLHLQGGRVVGADAQGGLYDGIYTSRDDGILFQVEMTVPPGVTLVQGVPPRPTSYVIPFTAYIPFQAIENALPVLVELPPGPVNVIFKLLRKLED